MLSFILAAALGPSFDNGATPLHLTALLIFTGVLGFALDICLITLYRATPPRPDRRRGLVGLSEKPGSLASGSANEELRWPTWSAAGSTFGLRRSSSLTLVWNCVAIDDSVSPVLTVHLTC